VAEDVEGWRRDEAVAAWREPWTTRLGRWGRRHRVIVTGGVVAVLLGVAALIAITVLVEQHAKAVEAQRNQLAEAHDRERKLAELGQRTIEAMTDEKALTALRTAKELTPAQKAWLQQA